MFEEETNKQGNFTKRQGNKETHKPVYKSLDDRSRGRQRWRGDGQDQDCPAKSAKWICAPSLKNRQSVVKHKEASKSMRAHKHHECKMDVCTISENPQHQ